MKTNNSTKIFLINWLRLLGMVVFAASFALNLNGQALSTYSFAQSSGTYKQAGTGATLTTSGCYDDGNFAAITIPFTFTYHGTAFTTITAQQNGFAILGGSGSGYSGLTTYANCLSPLNNDLYGCVTNGADFTWNVVGGTPNRVLTLQWYKWGIYSTGQNEFSFQIKLYETSNKIQFIYQNGTGTGATSARVGLTGAATSDFQTRTTTTSWAATTAGAANSATCTVSSTVRPTNGLTFTWASAATVAAMAFTQSTGTFVPIEGGTATSLTTTGSYDDASFAVATLPFTFTYHGVPYTTLVAGMNGQVVMGGTTGATGYSAICNYANTLSAINNDLYGLTANGAEASYITLGTAPNRTFVIQWSNWGIYSSGANEFSMQIRLKETTNSITYMYGPSLGTNSTTAYVGLTGATTSDFKGRSTTSNWSATTAGASSCASTCTINSTVRPVNGLTFLWAPPTSFPCSGTPAPGATLSTSTSVCAGASFTLSMATSFVTVSGLTFQWQSDNGTGFTNIAGATSSTYTTTLASSPTSYHCIVTCTATSGTATSTDLAVSFAPFYGCYCTSGATSTADEDISNVTFGTLNNSSTCTTLAPGPGSAVSFYSNYISGTGAPAAPSVSQLQTVPFSVTMSTCGGSYGNSFDIYIDYNHNGSFSDAGELVYDGASFTGNHTDVGNILIPLTALTGLTAMRVVVVEGGATSPCGTYTWGETEDYLINITAAPACTGTPDPCAAVAPTNACSGQSFALSLTPQYLISGLTFQWQSSPDGFTWTNIAGATSQTASVSQTAATYYQCLVNCTAGGFTTTSSNVMVGMNSFVTCYCNPTYVYGTSGLFYGVISNVTLNTLNHAPPGLNAQPYVYVNPPVGNATTQLVPGQTYTLSITSGIYNGIGVWIDFNQSGTYDASEYFNISGNNNSTGTAWTGTATVTVPANAVSGLTGMRVSSAYYCCFPVPISATAPCQAWSYGETEDYKVTVVPVPATPGAITEQPSPNCAIGGFLDVTGSAPSGQTWYWQTSATGTSTASPVSGSYNILANGTYYVRSQSNAYLNWGPASSFTVTDFPVGPVDPIISAPNGNPACGAVTLVSSTAAAFSSNYWQGTNSTGTSTATLADDGSTNNPFAAPANGTYYLRAQDNSTFCWSNPVAVPVTIYPLPTTPIVAATPSVVCPGTPSVLSAVAPSAPAAGYSVSAIPYAPPSPIATTLANAGPIGDEGTVVASLGFPFSYYGTTYTQVQVHTDGYIVFGSSNYVFGSYTPPAIPSTANTNNWVGYWSDLNASAGQISYATIGTAPNRKFIANYNQDPYYLATPYYSGQIVVNEIDGSIDVFLAHTQTTNTSACGMENLTGSAGTVAPGRNSGLWAATNEAWHFAPIQLMGFLWTPNGPANGLAAGQETLANATATPSTTTTYTMTLTEPAHGCQSSGTVTVTTLTTPPAPTTTGGATVCGSGTVTLSATTSGGTLNWYTVPTGGTSIATGTSYTTPIINANTTYYVEETNGTCSGPRSAVVAVFTVADPVTVSAVNGAVCNPGGLDATLTASSANGFYNYTWSPAPLSTSGSNGEVATVHPSVTTTYTVTGFDGSCSAQATVTVTVTNTPVITGITATPATVCQGGTSQIIAAIQGATGSNVPPTYCAVTNAGSSCITSVILNTLNSTPPACVSPYYHYNAPTGTNTTALTPGQTYTLSLVTNGTSIASVWIDYNRDGIYSASEHVQMWTAAASGTGIISVPVNAQPGATGMRVRSRLNGNPNGPGDGCLNMGSGSTEDYTISIQGGGGFTYVWTGGTFNNTGIFNPIATLGAPSETYSVSVTDAGCTATGTVTLSQPVSAPGNTLSSANPVCGGSSFTLSVQNPGVGAAFQWQSSPNGTTWTDIVGATNATYAASQTSDTYYRNGVGCALSYVYSNAILVMMACNAINGGTTLSTNTNPCAGTSFNLSLSGNTSVCVTYQWQWSLDGITYSNISGATASTLTQSQGVPYYYQCVLSCTGGSTTGTSTPVFVGVNTVLTQCYCIPVTSCSFPDIITNVTFGTINRTSLCDAPSGGWSMYSAPNPSFNLGSTNAISVSTGGDVEGVAVWIDFNQNGTFDPSELTIHGYAASNPATYSGTITVPAGAATGTTVMRVRCLYAGDPSISLGPCASTTYGETEDYNITIVNPTAALSLVCYIQGYYLGAGMMTPTIQNEDTDPITPPNYLATDCDQITVELHANDAVNGYPMVGTFTGMLHTDGTISCTFPGSVVGMSCYIVLIHRNSLQTWSSAPMTIAATNTYNFSTAATQALGDNEIDVASEGIYSIYNGDINQDFATDATDFLIMDADIQSFNGGYINTDLNGDGATDATDFLILDGNIQGFIGAVILP